MHIYLRSDVQWWVWVGVGKCGGLVWLESIRLMISQSSVGKKTDYATEVIRVVGKKECGIPG